MNTPDRFSESPEALQTLTVSTHELLPLVVPGKGHYKAASNLVHALGRKNIEAMTVQGGVQVMALPEAMPIVEEVLRQLGLKIGNLSERSISIQPRESWTMTKLAGKDPFGFGSRALEAAGAQVN